MNRYILGEVKLAITIHLLASGDPLGITIMFDISSCHYKAVMDDVVKELIIPLKVGNINMISYLEDNEIMSRVGRGYSQISNGVLTGANTQLMDD